MNWVDIYLYRQVIDSINNLNIQFNCSSLPNNIHLNTRVIIFSDVVLL